MTGGKTRLGWITRAGNAELRKLVELVVLEATSMACQADRWNGATGLWMRALLGCRLFQLATVALANKMVCIAWR